MNPPDERILRALLKYRYLEALHLCRLLYSDGSLTSVQTRCLKLFTDGYLDRKTLVRNFPQKGTYVYFLTRKGLNVLAGLGEQIPERYHAGETRGVTPGTLDHTLDINHVLVSLEKLAALLPQVAAVRVLPEHLLRKASVRVETTEGSDRTLKTAAVIPDAWFDVRVGMHGAGGYRTCISLEVDRGGEGRGGEFQKRWRGKVRALTAWWNGPYAEAFGEDAPLTIAVLATSGEKRHANLLKWTEAELVDLGLRELGELFRFRWGDPADVPYHELFCGPRWYTPFGTEALPLLPEVAISA